MDQKNSHRRRRFALILVISFFIIGFSIFDNIKPTPLPDKPAVLGNQIKTSSAIDSLGKLAVKNRDPQDSYSRAEFGSGWATVNGCDMRNQILKRDLTEPKIAEDGCIVLSGKLDDPYTTNKIDFLRGKDSDKVQIDHIVALSNAWQTGAQELTRKERIAFANDPLNLLAVDGPTNIKKSDSDAANWLPNKIYACRYVARQIAVKIKYLLWVTQAEFDAIKRVLQTCPDQVLPIETK